MQLPRYARQVVSGSATLRSLDERVGLVGRVEDVTAGAAQDLFEGRQSQVMVGATIGAAVCSAVALTVAPGTGVVTVIFFVVYQQFENFILVPRVMREAVDMSPAGTIVAVLIGAALLGVAGALLAVPLAAAVQPIATEVIVPRQEAL